MVCRASPCRSRIRGMKFMALAVIIASLSCKAPDEVSFGLGHTLFENGTASNETQTVALDQGDSTAAWVEVTYFVRPRSVYVVQEARAVDWSAMEHQEPDLPTVVINTGDDIEVTETTNNTGIVTTAKEAVGWFDSLGLPTQIAAGLFALLLLWICRGSIRHRVGRMLKRGDPPTT